MATHLSARMRIDAQPDGAFALLTDEGYVADVATATGGHDVSVSVTPSDDGGAEVVSKRVLPAALPSYAKAFVGDELRLTETRIYGPAAPDGRRDGTFAVDFDGTPISVTGTLRLVGVGGATDLLIEMDIMASVPLVGGKVESLASEWIGKFVAKEEQVAATYDV